MVIEAKSILGSPRGLKYQADDKGQSVEILRNGLIGDEPKDWHKQMRAVENQNTRTEQKRLSVVIAPSKEVSHTLKEKDWKKLAESYLEKQGIDKDNHQYIGHFHNSTDDKHLHLTVSRINFEGKNAINDSHIGRKSGSIADRIAKENGWRTAKEISAGKKLEIGNALRSELSTAKNLEDLSYKMRAKGFHIQLSKNEAKGVYGMRISKLEDINRDPSVRVSKMVPGYKLSEIEKTVGLKAKFSIGDIKESFIRNNLNPIEQRIIKQEQNQDQSQEKKRTFRR